MLYRERIAQTLETKRDVFERAARGHAVALARYQAALDQVCNMGRTRLAERLAGVTSPGAVPTVELERGLVIPFGERWENGDQARAWALETLRGTTTVAVDGSQVAPSKEYGVPIGMVQVAWFENHHEVATDGSASSYVKDVAIEVMTDEDLNPDGDDDPIFLGEAINQRRFVLEVARVITYLNTLPAVPMPVVLLDGSLVLSFAGQMRQESRATYIEAIVQAIAASTRRRIPLTGYIDTSYARDLTNMVWHAGQGRGDEKQSGSRVYDAQLLASRMAPFDRTAAFICARGDVLSRYKEPESGDDFSRQVAFVYLQTGLQYPPVRIEFPAWLIDAFSCEGRPLADHGSPMPSGPLPADEAHPATDGTNLIDHLVDIVRAEIVVGSGYPYALEAADVTAVLSTEDRMAFFRVFHDFAESNGLRLGVTGKMASKRRRR